MQTACANCISTSGSICNHKLHIFASARVRVLLIWTVGGEDGAQLLQEREDVEHDNSNHTLLFPLKLQQPHLNPSASKNTA